MKDTIQEIHQKMDKSIAAFHSELSKIRTGRASPSLLDHIMIDYYGNQVPVKQVANISTESGNKLTLNVWEKEMVSKIEKAIQESDLAINPMVKGTIVHLNIPPLTEERRKELVKLVHKQGEIAKISIRNIRRDGNQHSKKLLKDKTISEDQENEVHLAIQKMTDEFITQIDHILVNKDKELTQI